MPLGWENNTKYRVKSAKFVGGTEIAVGNARAPHPLYETQYNLALKNIPKIMLIQYQCSE